MSKYMSDLYGFYDNSSERLMENKVFARNVRKNNISTVGGVYENLAYGSRKQSYLMVIGLLGSILKIISAGINPTSLPTHVIGRMLDEVGNGASLLSQITTKYSESSMTIMQGKLEQIKDYLSDDNRRESELEQLVRELHQTMDSALEKAHRQIDSPFTPN